MSTASTLDANARPSRRRHVAAAALAVVVVVASTLVPVTVAGADASRPGGTFVDDDGSSHEGYIEAVAARRITRGCNPPANNRFCPRDEISRGQMAAFIARARKLTAGAGADIFKDDDGSRFESDIDKLGRARITRGCAPRRFCPKDSVTRGQMAAFIVRAFGLTAGADRDRFVDDDRSRFERDINRLAAAGITRGCNPPKNNRFCPHDPVSRAEMATFVGRAMKLRPMIPPPRGGRTWGNPDGDAPVPRAGRAADVSRPDHVIGSGTPASCTSAKVVAAVARGGVIVFDCGPKPVTIRMRQTAKVRNDRRPDVVIDGGGLVTLSGGRDTRILYMNTCDPAQVWTTSHCNNQDHPRLTVQNMTFANGFDAGTAKTDGGGAIWSRGGQLKIVNSRFIANRCTAAGPDVGGAVRAFDQYRDRPVYVVSSTFGGSPALGNRCSSGAGLSSIGVSWTIINSLFTHNRATGSGAAPARPGTLGGGNGGAMAFDGNDYHVRVLDTLITDNHANEGGGGIFFVSNNRTGTLTIDGSTMRRNPSDRFETIPGIFYLGNGPMRITDSIIR